MRVRGFQLNGGFTDTTSKYRMSYYVAESYYSENSPNNSWNINFNNGNLNNNNKYNTNYVRAVTAFDGWLPLLISLFVAYKNCLKGKTTSSQAIEYRPHSYQDILLLSLQIYYNTYVPSVSTCFMVTFPKLREVFAASFRDRIIHHWICIRMLPLFEQRCKELGDVSHACRKGFGTKTAIQAVEKGIKQVTCNHQKEAWIYKGDLVGFFMNINKNLLWIMLKDLIDTKYNGDFKDTLLSLVNIIVMHSPENNCIIQSDIKLWKIIEKSKSLFYNDDNMINESGEPIGNLTTQIFAGYYNSFLDEYVIQLFNGMNYCYVRSVDDFVIICDDKLFLKKSIGKIGKFTKEFLLIECHFDKIYFQPASHGVQFLGQVIKYGRTYTINRTRCRFLEVVKKCVSYCEEGELNPMDCSKWQARLNSYFGFFVHTRSWNIRKEVMNLLSSSFYKYFYIINSSKVKVKKKYRYEQ